MIPALLILSAVIIAVLVARLKQRSGSGAARPGTALTFLVMVVLPVLWLAGAIAYADTATKETSFCLRCHEMQPYGDSVTADNASVPATHFRNNWVRKERACYVCHTTPDMAGVVGARMKGLRDVYVHYLGEVPEAIHLDEPYDAGICLKCHAGTEEFLGVDVHAPLVDPSAPREPWCGGCHAVAHDLSR